MANGARRGKVKRGGRRPTNGDDSIRKQTPTAQPPLPRLQHATDFLRSAAAKGAHAAAAELFKRAWLLILGGPLVAALLVLEFDISPWFKREQPVPSQTNSIIKPIPPSVPDFSTMNALVGCNLKRHREIERLVDRRKYAWSLLEKCRADWNDLAIQKQIVDEACAPHLARYRVLWQQVKDREADDECLALAPK